MSSSSSRSHSRAGSSAGSKGLIDVTSNTQLLQPPVSTAASPEEAEGAYKYFLLDGPVTREQLCHYRNAAERAQSELAALLVKYECAQAELLDLKSKIVSKEITIQELKGEVGIYKENHARQSSQLFSVQNRLQEIEKESGTNAVSKKQADLKVQTLLQENLKLKEKIHMQEDEIRKYLNESDESKMQASKASREYSEFIAHLCHFFHLDVQAKEESQELLLSKISSMCEENGALKRQMVPLKEATCVHEMESKANRETIMRLASELSKEQEKVAAYSQDKKKLSEDLNNAMSAKGNLEKEIRALQGQLAESQRAWEISQDEMSFLKKCCSKKDEDLKRSKEEARTEKNLHSSFKEQVTSLLGKNFNILNPSKEAIVEKIRELCQEEENRNEIIFQLEAKITKLTEMLESQTALHHEVLQRNSKAENKYETLHDQLTRLEAELVSGDVIQEALKLEKQKYLKFLDQLSEKMNLGSIATDIGFDMRLDAVLARVEQLIKLEGNTLTEKKILIHNLQRKLKTQKEQLDNKEIHMKLLRQKIAQLEEEKQVRTALAVERDEANLTVRKLQKKVDRLQNELALARETNVDLKAKLADTNELKIKMLEQDKTIDDLSKSQEKLEKLKAKAEKQLTSVKSELHDVEREAKEDKEKAKTKLESVTSELATFKSTLDSITKRERQLADFREVVSRMLGLDIATMALPDYEIITRLEGLIHSHHFVPCLCFKDMPVKQDDSLQLLH